LSYGDLIAAAFSHGRDLYGKKGASSTENIRHAVVKTAAAQTGQT